MLCLRSLTADRRFVVEGVSPMETSQFFHLDWPKSAKIFLFVTFMLPPKNLFCASVLSNRTFIRTWWAIQRVSIEDNYFSLTRDFGLATLVRDLSTDRLIAVMKSR